MLLDALKYVFEADNRQLNQEIGKSEKKVDEFSKSMKSSEQQAEALAKKVTANFKSIGVGILATLTISKLLSNAMDYSQRVDDLRTVSDNLGIAIGEVDALSGAVERLGGQGANAQASLSSFSENVGKALKDSAGGSAKAFTDLGIKLKDTSGQAKDTMKLMGELSETVSKMDRPKALATLKNFGISDPKTVELMLKGRSEMERLLDVQKQSGVITEKQAEQARKYTEVMARYKQATGSSADAISQAFLPILTSLFTRLAQAVEWMNKNQQFVKAFFIGVATIVTLMFLPAIVSAAAAVWALISPFVAVGALIVAVAAAFAFLYDDIMHFLDGHDSLIGRISKDYPIVGEIIKAFAGNVKAIWKLLTGDFDGARKAFEESGEAIKKIFSGMGDYLTERFNNLLAVLLGGPEAAEKMKEGMVGAFQVLDSVARGIFNALLDFIKGIWKGISGIYDSAVGMVSDAAKWVGDVFGLSSSEEGAQQAPYGPEVPLPYGGTDNGANATLAAMAGNPINAQTSQGIANRAAQRSESNIQIGEITVETQATDAQGMAAGVKGELSSQLANLQTESSSGVSR